MPRRRVVRRRRRRRPLTQAGPGQGPVTETADTLFGSAAMSREMDAPLDLKRVRDRIVRLSLRAAYDLADPTIADIDPVGCEIGHDADRASINRGHASVRSEQVFRNELHNRVGVVSWDRPGS